MATRTDHTPGTQRIRSGDFLRWAESIPALYARTSSQADQVHREPRGVMQIAPELARCYYAELTIFGNQPERLGRAASLERRLMLPPWSDLTNHCQRALKLAGTKSQRHGHSYVWDTDVIEAMLEDPASIACTVLTSLGLSIDTFENTVARQYMALGPGTSRTGAGVKDALLAAHASALSGHVRVSTGHLMKGILVSPPNTGAQLSHMTGVPLMSITSLVDDALRQAPLED